MDTKNYTGINIKKLEEQHQNINIFGFIFNKYSLLTGLLIIFHLCSNLFWIYLNQNPLDYDPIGHTLISMNYAEYFRTHLTSFNINELVIINRYYPDFLYIISTLLVFIAGNTWKVIQTTGTLFFLLSILGIYLYIYEISKKPRLSFLTVFFYSFFISIVQYSRLHMLDIPLIALIIFTMYFWERFGKTHSYKYLYASAITFACAELTKWNAIVFLFIPLIALVIALYKEKKFKNIQFVSHCILAIALVAAFMFPWYYYNLKEFLDLGLINIGGEADDPHNLFSLVNILFYPSLVMNYQTHFIGFILFIGSLYYVMRRRAHYFRIPGLTSIFVYIFFTFLVVNKNIRVIFPIMPFVALVMAYGVDHILTVKSGKHAISRLIIFIVSLYSIFAFFVLSFGIPFQPTIRVELQIPLFGTTEMAYLHTYPVNLLYSARKVDYKAIVNSILSKTIEEKGPAKVLIATHLPYFHNDHIISQLYENNQNDITHVNSNILNKRIVLVPVYEFGSSNTAHPQILNDMDIIMTTAINPIHPDQKFDALYAPIQEIHQYLISPENDQFVLSGTYALPDKDKLLMYINKKLLE